MKYNVAVKGDPDAKKLGDCPFTQRVLITLAAKGLEYDMEYVDFARKPEWVMQASGGKVPILRQFEQGLVMPDSDVITEYLEKEHPEPSMKSKAPAELATGFFPTVTPFLKAPAGSGEDAEARAKMEGELQAIEAFLSAPGNGPLIGGASIDAKDASLAPKLYHASVAAKDIKGYSIMDKYPAIKKYFDALAEMPAWKQTLPEGGDKVIQEGWKRKVAGLGH